MIGAAERDRILDRVRALSLGLPETSERPSHGAPTFFVRGKRPFVMVLTDHHGDGRLGKGERRQRADHRGADPGQWQPTPPDLSAATSAHVPFVTPFATTSSAQFRPGPPPALDSEAYATAFNAAKAIGPFAVPKLSNAAFEFWAFKSSAGDAPTTPAIALQLTALGLYDRWRAVLAEYKVTEEDLVEARRHAQQLETLVTQGAKDA